MMRGIVLGLLLVSAGVLDAQQRVTPPREQFGHDIGADYVLPNYGQLADYWSKLDAESDRMVVQEIGKSAEGRPQLMAIITSPANHERLARYREIARTLALAEGVSEAQARALAVEGKAVVWIDGGLHATEVLGAQQLMETVYQLVSRDDPETTRILDDVIVLAVHANPDGHDLVADWYMRHPEPTKRSTAGLPRLYQKHAGHDNNRDSYMNALPETENMSRVQFREWFPRIVYNHHQTGPTGAVLFAPPFRDPFNYNIDPLIQAQIDAVGAAMHSRFIAEDKPGAVTRRGASYSTWWNGGIRTAVYFHNMIGLLTETIGNPTPVEIPFVARYQLPSSDIFMPIAPQKDWRFRQSIDYSVTANYAVLDYAARYRETLLYQSYDMARKAIERGTRDHWTRGAWDVERARAAYLADSAAAVRNNDTIAVGRGRPRYETTRKYADMLREPGRRDARAYVLRADQPDFATATTFVNALIKSGVDVHRARAAFAVGGTSYPAGSYVVMTGQAFRAHVLDMFEPQQHPNDFQYPGGPPIAPYDNAGYTLAYQMGVRFDRVLAGIDAPLEKIAGVAQAPPGRIGSGRATSGYTFAHDMNNAFTAVNRLLTAGHMVSWLDDGAGTFFVHARPGLDREIQGLAAATGVSFTPARSMRGQPLRLQPVRVALLDQYGGSMPSGWIRYILEQFDFSFDVVYPPTLDAGDLRARYDVIILPSGAIRAPRRSDDEADFSESDTTTIEHVPAEWSARRGRVTEEKTAPQLKAFMEQGGTVIAIGSSTRLAQFLGLPIEDVSARADSSGRARRLRREEFYVPTSVLETRMDRSHPLTAGLPERVNVMFSESPAFRLGADAQARGIRGFAWYEKNPLRSGWAWGQPLLENTLAAIDAPVGAGRLFLFGPEITFRAQSHGSFKLLFNSIYYGAAAAATAAQ